MIHSIDKDGKSTYIDARDYYVVNYNDTSDYVDKNYDA